MRTKLSEKLRELPLGHESVEEDYAELDALAAAAEALEIRLEAYECLQRSTQKVVEELAATISRVEAWRDETMFADSEWYRDLTNVLSGKSTVENTQTGTNVPEGEDE